MLAYKNRLSLLGNHCPTVKTVPLLLDFCFNFNLQKFVLIIYWGYKRASLCDSSSERKPF